MEQQSFAVQTTNLQKSFGKVTALTDLSITVEPGTVVAILGPNGAGKTTTINILTTQLEPDGGSATVLGHEVVAEAKQIRKTVGITFQETSVDPALTGEQVLLFSGEIYGMKRSARTARAKQLLSMVGLTDAAKRKTKTYSGGMKRRLELARSLMNTPKLLILDEPTLGLDPQTRATIWDYIRALKDEQGTTILLTTHYMDEAEELADFVYIVDRGTVVEKGNPRELIHQLGEDRIHIHGSGNMSGLSEALKAQDYVQTVHVSEQGSLLVGVDSGQRRVPDVLAIAAQQGCVVHEVEINRPTLGDVFLSATGREIRD